MSRYQLITDSAGVLVIDKLAGPETGKIVRLVSMGHPGKTSELYAYLSGLLSAPAQFEVTQRLMSEEEFRQVQDLRMQRKAIESRLETVAVERRLEVRIGGVHEPHLSEAAIRGVLGELMDDLARNGNAIRKLGVEPFAIDKPVAEAVEAALAVFLEPGAAE